MDEELRKKAEEAAKKQIEEAVRRKFSEHLEGAPAGGAFVSAFPMPGEPVLPAFGYAPYATHQLPRATRPYIMTVELLEDGMVVRYSYPVKKTVTTPGYRGFGMTDPSIKIFFEGLMEALDGGEDWNEEGRQGKLGKILGKMQALSAPKKVEKYFYETRSSVCKNAADFENATKAAREADKLIRELQDKGEVIQQGGSHIGQCFPPGEVIGGGEPMDYTLGA
jgi:hypothetical protein